MKQYTKDQTENYVGVFGRLIDLHNLYISNKRDIKSKEKKEIEELIRDINEIPEELKIKKFKQMLKELEEAYQNKIE